MILKRFLLSLVPFLALSLSACNSGNTPSVPASSGDPAQSTTVPTDGFQVTFETKGGTQIEAQLVKNGEKATKPADPTNPGQIFTGWFKDFDAVTPFNFDEPITSVTVIYAGWEIDRDSFYGGGGGGGSSSSQPQGDVTYTCTDLPEWITNDGCVVFAWAWPQAGQGAWYSTTISGTSCSFNVTQEMAGFLLARCAAGTTTPDWNKSGDGAGKVYNKTADISCTSGTYSYSCSSWQDA